MLNVKGIKCQFKIRKNILKLKLISISKLKRKIIDIPLFRSKYV